MEPLDAEGVFWTDASPDRHLFGRLRFDSVNGVRLTVQGTFHEETAIWDTGSPLPTDTGRILGSTRGRPITLDHCWCVGREIIGLPTPAADVTVVEEYVADYVLDGLHFGRGEPLLFDSVNLKLRHLEHWVNEKLVTSSTLGSAGGYKNQLVAEPGIGHRAVADLGTVYLYTGIGRSIQMYEWSFRQQSSITLSFAMPQNVTDVMRYCVLLQNLLTIGAHGASRMYSLNLSAHRSESDRNTNVEHDTGVRLYASHPSLRITLSDESPIPQNMLFTFGDFGGAPSIAKWCNLGVAFESVIEDLVSAWYTPFMPAATEFRNFLSAAETLIRVRKGQQHFNLKIELANLAQEAGPNFQALVKDTNQWATDIVKTRINRVVHRGLHESGAPPEWDKLAKSLYFAVVIALLKDCGMAHRQLEIVGNKLYQHCSGD